MIQTVGNRSRLWEDGSSRSKEIAAHTMLAIKQRPQNPVLIKRYLACKPKTPRTWLVICVIDDKKATSSTSGDVLTLFRTIDRVKAMAFPSPDVGTSVELVLVNRFQPS
jgi:hypothetical protein